MIIRYYELSQLVIDKENKTIKMTVDESWNRNNDNDQKKIQGTFQKCLQDYERYKAEGFIDG